MLAGVRRGIEKESLRVTAGGELAQTPHPAALGSALTHPAITTDYSEALLEFITPVCGSVEAALAHLDEIHRFTYANIGEELLWCASMPCVLEGDADIPVARYGSSNVAKMKTTYRYGLGYRYGRLMQTITGIHYNFSMPMEYWPLAAEVDACIGDAALPLEDWALAALVDMGNTVLKASAGDGAMDATAAKTSTALRDYITARYLGLIRNFQRGAWLLVYLLGASPAVCASFLRGGGALNSGGGGALNSGGGGALNSGGGGAHGLQAFDPRGRSWHAPYGTALRMGDLGYTSRAQQGLDIRYNCLDTYIAALREAITRPHPDYGRIGLGSAGLETAPAESAAANPAKSAAVSASPAAPASRADHNGCKRQLNTGLLQIENEFYSPIRPKRVARSGETPLGALRRGGIEYIEVRCVDVNPYHPLGIGAGQARFIDLFLLRCLLADSPPCDADDRARSRENLLRVVRRGREPGLQLLSDGGGPGPRRQSGNGERPMAAMAAELLAELRGIAEAMDAACGGGHYAAAWAAHAALVEDPDATPSARILRQMAEEDIPFFHLAMAASRQWAADFRARPLPAARTADFTRAAADSLAEQARLEAEDAPDFETYLAAYYRQYDAL